LETGNFQSFQIRLVKNDGDVFYVNLECILVQESHHGLSAIRIAATDITELRRSEEKLRQSEEKYRALFESLEAGYCVIEMHIEPDQPLDFKFIEVNKAFERQSTLINVKGRWMRELRPNHEESWFEIYRDVALTGQPKWFEHFGQELNKRWFTVHAFRIGLVQQRRVAVLFYDITERKQAEKALQQLNADLENQVAERTAQAEDRARQLQSLAIELMEAEERERERISTLLHEDLQQILASIRFQVQAAQIRMPELTELFEMERMLSTSIAKTRRLSHDLSPAILRHSGLIGTLSWLSRQMRERFRLEVQVKEENVPELDSNTLKVFIFRAIQELLFNVSKHAEVPQALVHLSGSDGRLLITVSDQGRGFEPAILEPAEVTTGLGLLSLQERVSYIGGSLSIESAPGQGSRITLVIPTVLDQKIPQVCDPLIQSPGFLPGNVQYGNEPGMRVLVVDDHKVMRQGLIRLISGQPEIQIVGEAASGPEAIELAKELMPNIIIMDISMPEMDGIEATRRIKAMMPAVRVIGLTMFEEEHIASAMRQAGAELIVTKTASSSALLKAIYANNRGGD
jgi:PAS domain S-box-containing protein